VSETKIDLEQDQHEKVQAEIAKLIAETIAPNKKTIPETERLAAQTAKLYKELKWFEVVLIISATLAVVAIVKVFL